MGRKMICLHHIGNFAVVLTLVLYLAPHYHCIPISTPDGQHWWHNPCGPGEEISTRRPVAHPRPMKSFKRMKTQLGMAHDHYFKIPLEDMYSEVVGALEEAYELHWLPGKQREWFVDKFGSTDGNVQEVIPNVLHQLHKRLQTFAVTLDKLYRHSHREEHTQFGRRRSKFLFELCLELKKVLCEIEAFLSTVGQQSPGPPANSSVIPADKWDNRQDKTAVLIQDYGILNIYGKFLMDWMSIVDDLLKGLKKRKTKNKGQRKKSRGRKMSSSSQGKQSGSQAAERGVDENAKATPRASSGEVQGRVRGSGRNNNLPRRKNRRLKAARAATSEVREGQ